MNPGQGELCRDCRHFHPDTWQMGHPTPCAKVEWTGRKHVEPSLSEDGRRCDEYGEPEIGSQNPGLETESAEMLHGADALSGEIIVSATEMVEAVAEPLQFASD